MTHVPSVAAEFETPLTIARNPARLLLLALGGAVFIGCGIWMARGGAVSHRYTPETVATIGWLAILAGIGVIATVAVLVARKRPVMVLDRAGLTLYPALGRPTDVAWADMAGWSITKVNKENLLVIGLRDLDGYFASLQGLRRIKALRQTQRIGSPVSVALGDLLIDRETLFRGMNEWFGRFASDAATLPAER